MENYLQHHGILGQRWGVRRFQNEDGSLTPAGKERYRTLKETTVGINRNDQIHQTAEKIRSINKEADKLDDEFRKKYNIEYGEYYDSPQYITDLSNSAFDVGTSFINDWLKDHDSFSIDDIDKSLIEDGKTILNSFEWWDFDVDWADVIHPKTVRKKK